VALGGRGLVIEVRAPTWPTSGQGSPALPYLAGSDSRSRREEEEGEEEEREEDQEEYTHKEQKKADDLSERATRVAEDADAPQRIRSTSGVLSALHFAHIARSHSFAAF
jgi:hypothetical protein